MKGKFKTASFIAASMLILILSAPAQAAPTLGFEAITNNNPGDVAIGEAQLTVELFDRGSQLVEFVFANSGTEDSSITQIYFDNGSTALTLLSIASIDESDPGVDYDFPGASPPDLPAGNSISPTFDVTTNPFVLSLDPESPCAKELSKI